MIIIQQKTKQAKQTNKQTKKNIFTYYGSPIKSDLVSRSKN